MKTGKFHITKKKVILIVVLAAVVALIGVSLSRAKEAAKEKLTPQVQVSALKKTSLQDSISLSGTVQSDNSSNVYTTLTLPVKEVKVKVGDTVKAGQTLAVLDSDSLSQDVQSAQYSTKYAQESARLSLDKAKSDYENALELYNSNQNSDIVNAKAAATSAQLDLSNQQKSYDYNKYLYDSGELSKMALNQEQSKLTAAQNAYSKAVSTQKSAENAAQQNLKTLKNNYDLAQAKYNDKSQEISLEKQQQNLKDSVITAPVDGTVTVVNATVGAPASGVLFTLEDTNRLIVNTEIKEYDVDQVTVGKKVIIKTDATGSTELSGEVTRVSPSATTATQGTNNVTFAAEVKVDSSNPSLKIGMKARMNIVLSEKSDIYAVPYDAVLHKDDGSAYVLAAVKSGDAYKAKAIPVQTGLENDISIEISGDGISDGVQIVSNPENISDGSLLKL